MFKFIIRSILNILKKGWEFLTEETIIAFLCLLVFFCINSIISIFFTSIKESLNDITESVNFYQEVVELNSAERDFNIIEFCNEQVDLDFETDPHKKILTVKFDNGNTISINIETLRLENDKYSQAVKNCMYINNNSISDFKIKKSDNKTNIYYNGVVKRAYYQSDEGKEITYWLEFSTLEYLVESFSKLVIFEFILAFILFWINTINLYMRYEKNKPK